MFDDDDEQIHSFLPNSFHMLVQCAIKASSKSAPVGTE